MKHIFNLSKLDLTNLNSYLLLTFFIISTELCERSLIESREAVAKCAKRISVRDYSAYRLFH